MSALPSFSQLSPALQARAAAVAPAIAAAAAKTGVDFRALFETARLESGFNPTARARTSSATGLFQFLDSSWLETLARHGPKHGIAAEGRAQSLALRTDPGIASLMAAEFMAENGRKLESTLGRAASGVELYLAHFLGAGGAARFLQRMQEAPATIAAELFPKAAAANRSIFHGPSGPRSLGEVHALFARRLGMDVPLSAGTPGTSLPNVPGGSGVPARLAETLAGAGKDGVGAGTLPRAMEAELAARAARLILAQLGA